MEVDKRRVGSGERAAKRAAAGISSSGLFAPGYAADAAKRRTRSVRVVFGRSVGLNGVLVPNFALILY